MAIFITIYLVAVGLLALWTERSLEYVLTHYAHHVVQVPYWWAFVVQLFASPITVPFDFIVELIRTVVA